MFKFVRRKKILNQLEGIRAEIKQLESQYEGHENMCIDLTKILEYAPLIQRDMELKEKITARKKLERALLLELKGEK